MSESWAGGRGRTSRFWEKADRSPSLILTSKGSFPQHPEGTIVNKHENNGNTLLGFIPKQEGKALYILLNQLLSVDEFSYLTSLTTN